MPYTPYDHVIINGMHLNDVVKMFQLGNTVRTYKGVKVVVTQEILDSAEFSYVRGYEDDVDCALEFIRPMTEKEKQEAEYAEKLRSAEEKEQYLRLKKKFEGK